MEGERMNRREFLVRVLGLGGIAAASPQLAGCGGGEDETMKKGGGRLTPSGRGPTILKL